MKWLADIPSDTLVPVTEHFRFLRGERRGWNPMFYPSQSHEIEDIYLRPVLRSPKSLTRLIARPDAEGFCCGEELADLAEMSHEGARSWILRFQNGRNEKGVPLPRALARTNMKWYEMSDSSMADLIFAMNYDKRLFVALAEQTMFIDQRLIGLRALRYDLDLELCHALMNSLIGLFYIEALGFGRGLGALDLSATKLERQLHILNPSRLSREQAESIKAAFRPIVEREILNIEDELAWPDRDLFDRVVLEAFDLLHLRDSIQAALLDLYRIRQTVRG